MISEEDERVVSLSFDNKNFEKHAKESMSTLDKLKEKLMFKNVKEDSKQTLTNILTSVETIASKSYSIVDRTVDKIKDTISSKIVSTIRGITLEPLTSGWSKFGDKTRSVGTLIAQGYDIDTVTEQMKKLNAFTDETSYNFVDMVNSISKFTATGQSLENSVVAMEGIATWAALSGQNAQVASSAMYQLSQALSAGAMRREDWRSIQNYNMDTREFRQTALDAAVAVGTLQKNLDGTYKSLTGKGEQITLENFVNTLTENAWFTKDVMMEVYQTYGGAFDKIKAVMDENQISFSRALDIIKSSNTDIRKEFSKLSGLEGKALEDQLNKLAKIEKITEDDVDAFQKLYKIDSKEDARKRLEKYTKYVSEFGIKAIKAAQEARTFGDAIDSIKDASSTTFMNIYESIFGDYERAKSLWTDFANGLFDLFEPLFKVQQAFFDWGNGKNAEKLGGRDDLFRGIYAIADAVRNISRGVNNLFSKIFRTPLVDTLRKVSLTIKEVGYEFNWFVRQVRKEKVFANIGYAINNIISPFKTVYRVAKETFKEVFPKTRSLSSIIGDLARRFREFSKTFKLSEDSINKIRNAVRGVWSAINLIRKGVLLLWNVVISPAINAITQVLSHLTPIIFTVVDWIGSFITYLDLLTSSAGKSSKEFEKIAANMGILSEKLGPIAGWLKNLFIPAVEKVRDTASEAGEAVEEMFEGGTAFDNTELGKRIKKFGERFKELFGGFTKFKDIFEKYRTGEGFFNFVRMVEAMLDEVVNRIGITVDAFIGAAEVISENPVYQGVIATFKDIWTGVKWLYTNLIRPVLIMITESVRATALELYKALSTGDIVAVMDKINAVLKSGILYRLWKTFSGVKTILGANGILGILTETRKTLKSVRKYIDVKRLEVYSKVLKTFVGALLVLLGTVLLISLIPEDQTDKIWKAFGIVAAMLGAVALSMFAIAGAIKLAGGSLSALAVLVVGLSSIFLTMFVAITVVMHQIKNNKEGFEEALGIVEGIFTMIVGAIETLTLTGVLSKFSKKENNPAIATIKAMGTVMLGIAAAILSFAITAKMMKDVNSDQIVSATLILAGVVVALGFATRMILKGIKGTETAKNGIAAAITVIGLAAAMALVVVPLLESIANDTSINWNKMWESFGYIAATLLVFSGAFALMNLTSKNAMQNITAMLAFWGVCLVLKNVLIPALEDLSKSKWDMPTENLQILGITIGAIAALMLAIGGAIAIATLNTKDISVGKLVAIGATLAGFMAIIGAIVLPAIKGMTIKDLQGVVPYLAIVVPTFVGMIFFINAINKLIKNATEGDTKRLSLILVSLATIITAIGAVLIPAAKNIKDVNLVQYLGFMAAVVVPIITIIHGIKGIVKESLADYKLITSIVAGLAGVLLIIGAVLIPSLNKFTNTNAAGMLGVATIVIGSMATLLVGIYEISKLAMADLKTVIAMLSGVTAVILATSAFVFMCNKLTSTNGGAIFASALSIFVQLGTLFIGIYELVKLPNVNVGVILSTLLGMAALFTTIGLALIPSMQYIKNENALAIIASTIPVIATIFTMMKTLKLFVSDRTASVSRILATFGGMAAMLTTIGLTIIPALALVKNENIAGMLAVAASVSAMIGTLMYTFYLFNKSTRYVEGRFLSDSLKNTIVNVASAILLLAALRFVLPPIIESLQSISNVPWENILAVGASIAGFTVALGYLAKVADAKFAIIAGGITAIALAVGFLFNALSSYNYSKAFRKLADDSADGFEDGMQINSPSKRMMKDGKYVVQGLEKGIKKESKNLSKYGTTMGDTVDTAFRKMLGIHSPSKVMYENGRFVVVGLANGMSSYEGKKALSDSAKTLGTTIGDSVGASVSDALKDSVSEGFKGLFGDDENGLKKDIEKFINGDNDIWGSMGAELGNGVLGSFKEAVFGDKDATITEIGNNIKQKLVTALGLEEGDKSQSIGIQLWNKIAGGASSNSFLGRINSIINGDTTVSAQMQDLGSKAVGGMVNALNDPTNLNKLKALGETIGGSLVTGISDTLWKWSKSIPLLGDMFQGLEDWISEPDEPLTKFTRLVDTIPGNGIVIEGNGGKKFHVGAQMAPFLNENGELYQKELDLVEKGMKKESEMTINQLLNVLDEGVKEGAIVYNPFTYLYEFADELDEDSKEWMEKYEKIFKINSPSKWISDDIVGNLYKGIPVGIKKYESSARKKIDNAMSTLKSDISKNFEGLDMLANPDYKVKFSFTPVFETSTVQNGVTSFKKTISRTSEITSKLGNEFTKRTEIPNTTNSIEDAINSSINNVIAAIYSSAAKSDINVNVIPDKDKMFDVVVQKTRQYKAQTGRSYQF